MRGRLAGLDAALGPRRAGLVRRELGPELCRRAQSRAVRLQPVEVELEIIETIERLFGRAGMRAWAHDHAVGIARRGAFGTMVNNAIRLFGVTPHGMSRAAARAWAHTFRDLGRLVHLGTDPEHVVLRWVDPPDWVNDEGAFGACLAGGLSACLTLAQRHGDVRLQLVGGDLQFTLMCAPLRVAS